jgi:hypothetical protein
MSIDDQRDFVSEDLLKLANVLRQDYQSKILDRRDQMNKASEASMRERIAAGETPQAARQQAYGSPGSDRARQLDGSVNNEYISPPAIARYTKSSSSRRSIDSGIRRFIHVR